LSEFAWSLGISRCDNLQVKLEIWLPNPVTMGQKVDQIRPRLVEKEQNPERQGFAQCVRIAAAREQHVAHRERAGRGKKLRPDSVTGVGIAFFWAPMRRVTAFGKDCQSPVTG
jgi:hypothetical protein